MPVVMVVQARCDQVGERRHTVQVARLAGRVAVRSRVTGEEAQEAFEQRRHRVSVERKPERRAGVVVHIVVHRAERDPLPADLAAGEV